MTKIQVQAPSVDTTVQPDTKTMSQLAPWPFELEKLVYQVRYRPGWRFALQDCWRDAEATECGLALVITTQGIDTHHPEKGATYRVRHTFIVPAAGYNRESWQRWLYERCVDVEHHEAMEFFRINGKQPYAPNHGPGWDPYALRELNRVEAAETTFKGERREGSQS